MPANLPQRNEPVPQRNSVPADIKEFLDRGRVENGTYIDYAGTPWVNLEGSPISRKDIEDLAITNPEDVRRLMKDTEEAYRKQQEKKQSEKKAKSDDVIIKNNDRIKECHIPFIVCIEVFVIIYKANFQFVRIKVRHDPFQYGLGIILTWGHDIANFTNSPNPSFQCCLTHHCHQSPVIPGVLLHHV